MGRGMLAWAAAAVAAAAGGVQASSAAEAAAAAPSTPTATAGPSTRLRINNACGREPIWIAHESGAGVGPDPQNVRIAPGASHDFAVYDNLKATRYWPKMRCDAAGNSCQLGDSGGPGESCDVNRGCGPPVDTKFEATFGQSGQPCDPSAQEYAGCDWLDVSLVDGFTLPFKLQIWGDCKAKFANPSRVSKVVDCSTLSFDQCPSSEHMGAAGANIDLQVRSPASGNVVGCYSPCGKLSFRNWNNTLAMHHTPGDSVAKDYCCPTPPESPAACRQGPVGATKFVNMVHRLCPGVYGYAYDDGMGLTTCPAGTRYEVSFYCPAGLSASNSSSALWEEEEKASLASTKTAGKEEEELVII